MKAKTVLITGGLLIAGIAIIAYQKVKTLTAIFEQMSIRPTGISSFSATLMEIKFDLDLKITNPTNEAFSVTGASLAMLKRIVVYRNGQYLGQAELNLEEIEIPAASFTILENVPFTISTQNLLTNLSTIESFNLEELSMQAVISVLGNEYIIEG